MYLRSRNSHGGLADLLVYNKSWKKHSNRLANKKKVRVVEVCWRNRQSRGTVECLSKLLNMHVVRLTVNISYRRPVVILHCGVPLQLLFRYVFVNRKCIDCISHSVNLHVGSLAGWTGRCFVWNTSFTVTSTGTVYNYDV